MFRLALEIRTDVFVKGQNVPAELEHDEKDKTAHHYLLFVDDKATATARWRETNAGIKLERFAVLETSRNLGLGAIILSEVLKDVIPHGKNIYLHSQEAAVNFYLKHGFKVVSERFEEAGIGHYRMELGDLEI